MKPATPCLQRSDIEVLLAGTAQSSQSELWEEHFSSCKSCRMAMAGQVGNQEWWREAERSLTRRSHSRVDESTGG
jgi:predicted anti-sigma-YlaC factor YlaD